MTPTETTLAFAAVFLAGWLAGLRMPRAPQPKVKQGTITAADVYRAAAGGQGR